jgi:membrane protease YdiL (CAAX protease family)
MLAKAAAIALLLGAALADSGGAHTAAYYLLLGAVPAAAVAALASLGDLVEQGARPRISSVLQTALGVLAVVLVVTTTTSRSTSLASGHVPQVGVSALVGCLILYALQTVVASLAELGRDDARRRERPHADRPLRRAA